MPTHSLTNIEFRTFHGEIRTLNGPGNETRIVGYAALYDQLSELLPGNFREKIAPGFFDNLNEDVRALFNHDPSLVLGRTSSGTLKLFPDAHGLRVEITPPNTQIGRDIVEMLRRKDVSQMSFAFTVAKAGDKWEKQPDGTWMRTLIRRGSLLDVSPVTYPAYPQTSVAVNSIPPSLIGARNWKAAAAARKRTLDLMGLSGPDTQKAKAQRAARSRTLALQESKHKPLQTDLAKQAARERGRILDGLER